MTQDRWRQAAPDSHAAPYHGHGEGDDGPGGDALEAIATHLADALRDLVELHADAVLARIASLQRLHDTSTQPTVERLLDLPETAEALGRSERWVRERVRLFELPVVRLDGSGLRFRRQDIADFINSHRVPAKDEIGRDSRRSAGG